MRSTMTRRTALQRLALAGAGLPLLAGNLAQAAGSEAPGQMEYHALSMTSFGVAGYTLRGMPLEQALNAVKRVGLEYFSVHHSQLPWENSPPGWAAQLAKFKAAGVIPVCCGVINLRNDLKDMRNAFDYARTLGVATITCSPEPEALPMLEKFVMEYDFHVAIHNHGPEDKVWPSPHVVWQAIQPFDRRIGLCIDVGHTYRAGADPGDCIRRYRDRLLDVHLKDSAAVVGTEDIPVEIGRGRIDQREVLAALSEISYNGKIWFEYEKDGNDPLPGLAESVGYIRGLSKGMRPRGEVEAISY